MAVVCHILLGLPHRGCSWLFTIIQYIVQTVVFQVLNGKGLGPYFSDLLQQFPLDIQMVTQAFNLEGQAVIYAICPTCHHTYPPVSVKGILVYPQECDARSHGSLSGELLVQDKVMEDVMIHIPL